MPEEAMPKTKEPELQNVTVRRCGTEIVLPENLTYAAARDWLTRIETAEETIINVYETLSCYPCDGIVSLTDALQEMYGFTDNHITVQIPCDVDKSRSALWGKIKPVAWNGGFVEVADVQFDSLLYKATVKRKYEPSVQNLFNAVRLRLKEKSLYKGRAVRVHFSARPTDIIKEAPQFMELNGVTENDLILNDDVMFQLASNVFTIIEKTDACRKAKIPLRHGILLAGPYGTGKSLTSLVIAGKSTANGWTFLYLDQVQQLAHALRMAELYAPAVVFAEDIDNVVNETRDAGTNQILNVLDGVDTKSKAIITMLTTNHLEKIHRSFLRAGRIDTIVEYQLPNAETAWKFVLVYGRDQKGRSILDPAIDPEIIGRAFERVLPAFIAEAVQKAKRYQILTGEELLTEEILVKSATAIRHHADLLAEPPQLTDDKRLVQAAQLVGRCLNRVEQFSE